ncbi:MAG: ABC transporter permease, partial [Acidimicrobiales bacterium]
MIRLAWRQFHTEAAVGIGALVVVAVVLAVTGPHLVDVYRASPSQVTTTDAGLQSALMAVLLVAPALIGIFFGAPLIARELETGTFRLAWTQGVTRARWLTVKLALVGLVSSVLAGGLGLMVAWWANPINVVSQNRFSPSLFGIFGIVPFGYALFAFALGVTTGLLFRRTLPAMATTLAAFVGVRFAVTFWIRPHFESPLTKSLKLGPNAFGGFVMTPSGVKVAAPNLTVPNGWVLSTSILDKAGNPPTSAFLHNVCPGVVAPHQGGSSVGNVGGGSKHFAP